MRPARALVSFSFIFLFWVTASFAQDSALIEQYKKALTQSPSQKSEQIPEKSMRGIGGVTSQATREDGGAGAEPSLTMHLEFKFNSDELTPQSVKYLDALGTALQDPDLRGYLYRVEGHTDSVGTDSYNLELSRKRAMAVADYMVKTFSLEREQFEVQAFGKKKPVASNDTEDGRQQNRRVVIVNTLRKISSTIPDRPRINVQVKYSRAKEEKELHNGDTLTQRDNYAIEFTPKTSAYVYIYQIDTMGNPTMLFPNSEFSQSSNQVEPGRLYRVPDLGKWLFLDENKGSENIVVIARKDEIKNPEKVCWKVLGAEQTMIASTKPASKSTGAESRTRGLGGTREERSVQGIRQELKVDTGTGTNSGETKLAGEPSSGKAPEAQSAPIPDPEQPIDMGRIFQWKLSFNHQ